MEQLLAYAEENGSSGSGMSTVWFVIGALGLWKMFEKAGVEGWAGLIPLYRDYKLCDKVMGDPWYWLRTLWALVPIIGWVLAIYYEYQICKATAQAYGKPESWAWGYLFLGPVFWLITGFDQSQYYGPFGRGDHRTGEARQAKTVNFDVVEPAPVEEEPVVEAYNEPVVEAYSEPVVEPVKESEEVEFDFVQDDLTE